MIDKYDNSTNGNLIYWSTNENNYTNAVFYRSTKKSSDILSLNPVDLVALNDCRTNAQLCGSYVYGFTQKQPF